jgi:hypothetical protein
MKNFVPSEERAHTQLGIKYRGKSLKTLNLARNELALSSCPAWLKYDFWGVNSLIRASSNAQLRRGGLERLVRRSRHQRSRSIRLSFRIRNYRKSFDCMASWKKVGHFFKYTRVSLVFALSSQKIPSITRLYISGSQPFLVGDTFFSKINFYDTFSSQKIMIYVFFVTNFYGLSRKIISQNFWRHTWENSRHTNVSRHPVWETLLYIISTFFKFSGFLWRFIPQRARKIPRTPYETFAKAAAR